MASTAKICRATTKSGAACRIAALAGSEFCWWHEPSLAAERKEARSRGVRARHGRQLVGELSEPIEIGDLSDVVGLVTEEINMVRGLERSISRARAVGYLAGILINVYSQSEMEQRIAALERQIGL